MTTQHAPADTARSTVGAPPPPRSPAPSPAEPSGEVEDQGQQLSGPRMLLDRLSTVRPGTVVVLLGTDEPAEIKRPGELVIPSWIPWRGGKDAVVVSTEPVTLRLSVRDLLTLDGESLASVSVEVRVRLRESDVAGLVDQYGAELGLRVTESAEHSVESSIRAAVGMNRAVDLRRQSLAQVLADRWLPKSFAQGALMVEAFAVRAVNWPGELDRERSLDQSAAADAGPADQVHDATRPEAADREGVGGGASPSDSPLRIGSLGREDRHRSQRLGPEALRYVHLPLAISVGVFWLFFVMHWVPEFQSFPGASIVLEQFAPLASKELTSQSQPLVGSQRDHLGLLAALLLIVSLLIPVLARSRWWLARLALWPLTYLAAISAVVILIGIVVRRQLGTNLVGVLLLVAWMVAALITTWRSLWVDIDTLPKRPARVVWILAVFALVNAAPVAVGRRLFAPELRVAAASVMQNDLTLRWAALLTPTTALLYLCGLLVAVVTWAVYLLWPPRRVSRRTLPASALALGLVGLLLVGPQAAATGEQRAEVIRAASPSDEVGFSCGAWVNHLKGEPAQTLVVNGLSCKRITTFVGYHEVATRQATDSLSPVNVETLLGQRIDGKLVGAAYGDVVVLASTDRFDNHATALVGLRTANADEIWRFTCPEPGSMKLRFVDSSEGDDAATGRLTIRGERAAVVVDCGGGAVRLDPRTGRRP